MKKSKTYKIPHSDFPKKILVKLFSIILPILMISCGTEQKVLKFENEAFDAVFVAKEISNPKILGELRIKNKTSESQFLSLENFIIHTDTYQGLIRDLEKKLNQFGGITHSSEGMSRERIRIISSDEKLKMKRLWVEEELIVLNPEQFTVKMIQIEFVDQLPPAEELELSYKSDG